MSRFPYNRSHTLANFDHRSVFPVAMRYQLSKFVLWNDESALLKRMNDRGGTLSLSECPNERQIAQYVCDRGFAVLRGKSLHLSDLGNKAARLVSNDGGAVVMISVEDVV